MIFAATKNGKNGRTKQFLPPLFVVLLDPGWIKIRIRDKHPGAATQQKMVTYVFLILYLEGNKRLGKGLVFFFHFNLTRPPALLLQGCCRERRRIIYGLKHFSQSWGSVNFGANPDPRIRTSD